MTRSAWLERRFDWSGLVESFYEDCPDHGEWARRILAELSTLFPPGTDLVALIVEHDIHCAHSRFLVAEGESKFRARWPSDAAAMMGPDMFRAYYAPPARVHLQSELARGLPPAAGEMVKELCREQGWNDALGLVVRASPTLVLVVCAGLVGDQVPSQHERRLLSRAALHLESGLRLRMRPEQVRAIFTPEGRLVHQEGDAPGVEELARHIGDIESARAPHRRLDARSLDLWTALVDGRVSVVARPEGGRRLYYVLDNPVSTWERRALSRREIEVLLESARGSSVKMVSYALGLSSATVSAALSVAASKLGVASRLELVRVAASLTGDPRAYVADEALTGSEREVLELLVRGLSNGEIARMRSRSVRTIANQVAALLRKTGAGSRRSLVANAVRVPGEASTDQSAGA